MTSTGALCALLAAAAVAANGAEWKTNPEVMPKWDRKAVWDGSGSIFLYPGDTNYTGRVFAADIAAPSADFDVFLTANFSSRANAPSAVGVVYLDGQGRERIVSVRADGVESGKLPRFALNGQKQDFLLQLTNGVVTAYWAEPGAAFVKLGSTRLGFAPKAINLQAIRNRQLHLGDFAVKPHASVPVRRIGNYLADDASRFQPFAGETLVTTQIRTKVSVPIGGRTTFRIGFDRGPNAGILYIRFKPKDKVVETCYPVYVLDDKFRIPCDIPGVAKAGETRVFPNARISVGVLGSQCVTPSLIPFASNRTLSEAGKDLLREWEFFEKDARKHVLAIDFVCDDANNAEMWIDGSYVRSFPHVVEAWLSSGPAVRTQTERRAAVDPRYVPLDLHANPKAKTFARASLDGLKRGPATFGGVPFEVGGPLDSQDVGLCRMAMGEYGLGSNAYRSRLPIYAYPMAVHFRVPAATYAKAHLVYALAPDARKRATMRLRLAHYTTAGCGRNMIEEVAVDGSDAAVRTKVGSVTLDGRKVPLYRQTVMLPIGRCLDYATGDYIDFEAVGARDDVQDSAFNLFAVTLERAPFDLAVVQKAAGNIFTADEAGKATTVRASATRAGKAELRWTAKDDAGATVFSGRRALSAKGRGETTDVAIPLDDATDWGLYSLDVTLVDPSGETLVAHPARFAILPPAGRLSDADITNSPYCTWWFHNVHGGYADREAGFKVLRKVGFHKVSWVDPTPDETARYGILGEGALRVPQVCKFDSAKGVFLPGKGLDGEALFVDEVKKDRTRKGWCDHINVWHENAPLSGFPAEMRGLAAPAATDAERAQAKYLNEVGRIVRKHFPDIRIKVGNTLGSSGACYHPFRGGAKAEYYDAIGLEPVNGRTRPEAFGRDVLGVVPFVRETARRFAGREVPVDATFEFVSHPVSHCGSEIVPAAYYVRDAMIGWANGFRLIPLGEPFDVSTGYNDTVWGQSGFAQRRPYVYPRPLCVALAVLTKLVDAPVETRVLETGSASVFAVAFKRADGRHVTVFWTPRGEAEIEVSEGGALVSMLGRRTKVGGFFGSRKFVAGECPVYLVTKEPVAKASVVARRYPDEAEKGKRAVELCKLSDPASVTAVADKSLARTGEDCVPQIVPAEGFRISSVTDAERGACLEVKVPETPLAGEPFAGACTRLSLREPVPLPKEAGGVGLWVKGDSNGGAIGFEVEDANGNLYRCNGRRLMTLDFDGWNFLSAPFSARDSQVWIQRTYAKSGEHLAPPLKLKSIIVTLNRHAFSLTAMQPVSGTVRLGGIGYLREGK